MDGKKSVAAGCVGELRAPGQTVVGDVFRTGKTDRGAALAQRCCGLQGKGQGEVCFVQVVEAGAWLGRAAMARV